MKMKCPQCQTENPEGARFCMECGLALEKHAEACPVCGTVNMPDAKFCMGCGLNLEENLKTNINKKV